MKITDIITESKKVNEAPVGMLKRAGLGIASKFGSTKAMGALDTAKQSNELKKAYDRFLGQTGQKPNSDNILAFLQRNGLPTGAAEKAIQQAGADVGVQVGPAKDMKSSLGIGKNAGGPMATPNTKEPTAEPAAAGTDPSADNLDVPAYKRKGMPEPKTEPFDAEKFKQSNLKSKLKGGRGIGKTTGTGFGAAAQAMRAKGLNMSHTPSGDSIMEVDLKGSTIDKIILAAVQDAIKQGMGQQLATVSSGGGGSASAADDSSGGKGVVGSFMSGVKRGLSGEEEPVKTKGNLNYGKLADLLPGVDPNQLRKSITNYMSGNPLTREQMSVMSTAFGEIVKMDPAQTTKALQLLKAVRAG